MQIQSNPLPRNVGNLGMYHDNGSFQEIQTRSKVFELYLLEFGPCHVICFPSIYLVYHYVSISFQVHIFFTWGTFFISLSYLTGLHTEIFIVWSTCWDYRRFTSKMEYQIILMLSAIQGSLIPDYLTKTWCRFLGINEGNQQVRKIPTDKN